MVGITLVLASLNSLAWNLLITKEATFIQVRKWLDENVDRATPIASTERRYFNYVPTAAAIEPIRKFKPNYYQRAYQLIGNIYPENVRNVLNVYEFNEKSKIANLEKGLSIYPVSWIVDSYWEPGEAIVNQGSDLELELVTRFYSTRRQVVEPVASILVDSGYLFRYSNFPWSKIARPGPYFDVLKVK